jgi:dipeptide transport system substrate-binding protein
MGLPELLKSVEKVDDYTVRITLTRVESPFLSYLATGFIPIQSKEYADHLLKAGKLEDLDQKPIGTGPFMLTGYQKGSAIQFKTFHEYWPGRARFGSLVFDITPDPWARLDKLKSGKCDVMAEPTQATLDVMQKNKDIMVLTRPRLDLVYLALNTQKKPLDNVIVRRALSLATDRAGITFAVYGPRGTRAVNPLPPLMWSYNRRILPEYFRPDQSPPKKLLTEAGYPEGFSAELWIANRSTETLPDPMKMAKIIQRVWARAGVKIEIKAFDPDDLHRRIENGEHQMVLMDLTTSSGDPDNFLYQPLMCSKGVPDNTNAARWCDTNYLELVQKGRTETEKLQRQTYYENAQRVFRKEIPWIPVSYGVEIVPLRKEVGGFSVSPFGRFSFVGVYVNK